MGDSCGYQIRLEHSMPREHGSILYCTTGVLLRRLVGDSNLQHVSHIVLDEIHERDIYSDFLLIILKDLICSRKDIKVVLMSATLNAEMFSEYFGNCPITNIPGYTYPVKEMFIEDTLDMIRYRLPPNNGNQQNGYQRRGRGNREEREKEQQEIDEYHDYLDSIQYKHSQDTLETLRYMNWKEIDLPLIVQLITYICNSLGDGAILVFLPGWDAISKLNDLLTKSPVFSSRNYIIIPLHSLMPTSSSMQVFDRPPPGVRKIVIATSIAETRYLL